MDEVHLHLWEGSLRLQGLDIKPWLLDVFNIPLAPSKGAQMIYMQFRVEGFSTLSIEDTPTLCLMQQQYLPALCPSLYYNCGAGFAVGTSTFPGPRLHCPRPAAKSQIAGVSKGASTRD